MEARIMMFVIAAVLVSVCTRVAGHGYLMDPPARNTAWREDPDNFEINWTDNQLNCGGFSNQWNTHHGKCGTCGDPYQGPYDHEAGGKYAKLDRHVTRCYNKADDVIDSHVVITSYHKGYFEFRLCEHNNMATKADQSCFDDGVLLTVHGTGLTRYDINGNQQSEYHFKLDKPRDVTCTQCILQWKYNAGNAWGCDEMGKCGTGVGPQEQFINCADIAVLDDCTGAVAVHTKDSTGTGTPIVSPYTPTASLSHETTPSVSPTDKTTPMNTSPVSPSSEAASGTTFHCRGVGDWNTPQNMEWWCTSTCKFDYSACPQNMCQCNGRP